jgi:hypothetical protein
MFSVLLIVYTAGVHGFFISLRMMFALLPFVAVHCVLVYKKSKVEFMHASSHIEHNRQYKC